MTGRELHAALYRAVGLDGSPEAYGAQVAMAAIVGMRRKAYSKMCSADRVSKDTIDKLAHHPRVSCRVISEPDGEIWLEEVIPERTGVAKRRRLLRQIREQVAELPGFELVEVEDG